MTTPRPSLEPFFGQQQWLALLVARLRVAGLVVATLWLAACSRAPIESGDAETGTPPTEHAAVATYDGGEVTAAEADALVQALPLSEREGARDELIEVYRRVAADRAVEEVLVEEIGGDDEVREQLADEWPLLRRQVLLERWLQARAGDRLQVDEERVREFWEEHENGFSPPSQRFVSMIFKRSAPDDPTGALDALWRIRERIERGEAFAEVARAESDSETRAAGGRLGWIYAGRLDPAVEEAVFALSIAEVSEPIPMRDGAALFLVQGYREGGAGSFDEVRADIVAFLVARERLQWLDELSADLEPPEGATVLDLEALRSRLVETPEAVVLEIADDPMNGELLLEKARRAAEAEVDRLPPLRRSQAQIVEDLYREDLAMRLLALEAEAEALTPDAERAVDTETARIGGLIVARRELDRRMLERVDEEALERFHADNEHAYTTPVEFLVSALRVPVGARPDRRIARLEAMAEEVRAGRLELAEVAERMNGRHVEPQWLDFAALEALPPKVKLYVIDLGGPGVTVPFRLGADLILMEVEERREPERLAYETVRERVEADYLQRHRQRLYREVADELLERVDFTFHREVVGELLSLGEPVDESAGDESAGDESVDGDAVAGGGGAAGDDPPGGV